MASDKSEKIVTASDAESGILHISSGLIESRHDGIGVPSDIYKHNRPLDDRQQKVLDMLPKYGSRVTVDKSDVSMMDLSALTAKTGDEFAVFTLGTRRLVVRGDGRKVSIDTQDAAELYKQGYKWSGHTHPGESRAVLLQSLGDEAVLRAFNQSTSVIYNSVGIYRTFSIKY